jgi:predicted ATPase
MIKLRRRKMDKKTFFFFTRALVEALAALVILRGLTARAAEREQPGAEINYSIGNTTFT